MILILEALAIMTSATYPMPWVTEKSVMTFRGQISSGEKQAVSLVTSQDQLKKHVDLITPPRSSPVMIDVDFARYFVIIIYSGKGVDLDYTEHHLSSNGVELRIVYRNRVMGIEGGSSSTYSPYLVIVIQRTDRVIRVYEDKRLKQADPSILVSRAILNQQDSMGKK